MGIEETISKQIDRLSQDANALTSKSDNGAAVNDRHIADCRGWIASAMNVIDLVCPNPTAAYRREAQRIADSPRLDGALVPMVVGALAALLVRLQEDVGTGLLTSLADKARAETFDVFLDHAAAYLKESRKNEASVIAGVVFEDTLRRICRKFEVAENGVNLDRLIAELVKLNALSDLKAKRARSAAALRTSATHARWDEIGDRDVQPVIDLTRELLETHLDR